MATERPTHLDLSTTVERQDYRESQGTRSLISFIEIAKAEKDVEFLSVVGNDCLMPQWWLNNILDVFAKTDVEILSPNVLPSNAAFIHGIDDTKGLGYRPSRIVGGLWNMRKYLVEDIYFERMGCRGIIAAFNVLSQIITEKNPKVGWLENVTVQDIGHWSGTHEKHIKTPEHKAYSAEVGRPISW